MISKHWHDRSSSEDETHTDHRLLLIKGCFWHGGCYCSPVSVFIYFRWNPQHISRCGSAQSREHVCARLCASKKGVNEILSECVHVCRSWHAYMHISDQILSGAGGLHIGLLPLRLAAYFKAVWATPTRCMPRRWVYPARLLRCEEAVTPASYSVCSPRSPLSAVSACPLA